MHDIVEKNPVCFILRFLHLYCIQAMGQLDNNGCMYITVKNFNGIKFTVLAIMFTGTGNHTHSVLHVQVFRLPNFHDTWE